MSDEFTVAIGRFLLGPSSISGIRRVINRKLPILEKAIFKQKLLPDNANILVSPQDAEASNVKKQIHARKFHFTAWC